MTIESRYFTFTSHFEVEEFQHEEDVLQDIKNYPNLTMAALRIDFDDETDKFTFTEIEQPKPQYWFSYAGDENTMIWRYKGGRPAGDIKYVCVKNSNGGLDLLAGTELDKALEVIRNG